MPMSELHTAPALSRLVRHFSKISEIQKCPKCQRGVGTLSQNFLLFHFDASPNYNNGSLKEPQINLF